MSYTPTSGAVNGFGECGNAEDEMLGAPGTLCPASQTHLATLPTCVTKISQDPVYFSLVRDCGGERQGTHVLASQTQCFAS